LEVTVFVVAQLVELRQHFVVVAHQPHTAILNIM
jgi:hypothetical protein